MSSFIELQSIALELGVPVEDVEIVAQIELFPDEWDEAMERVTAEGREVILRHFAGGADPGEPATPHAHP